MARIPHSICIPLYTPTIFSFREQTVKGERSAKRPYQGQTPQSPLGTPHHVVRRTDSEGLMKSPLCLAGPVASNKTITDDPYVASE